MKRQLHGGGQCAQRWYHRQEPAVLDANAPVFGLSVSQLNRRILVAGLGKGFSGHSGRVGMAQDLAATGVELPALMTAGQWKSSQMPARYTEQQAAGRGAVPRYYRERSGPNISNRISQSP